MDNRLSLTVKRIYRRRRRPVTFRPARRPARCSPAIATLLLAFGMAFSFIALLELRLRPVAEQLAARQVNNLVTAELNAALSGLSADYGGLVEIQRSTDGTITALTGNM